MATQNTLATRLAGWVAQLDYGRIPAPAVDAAKLLILDQLGLQIHGATLANVQPELRLVEEMRAAPESTIVHSTIRTTAPYAAFASGTLAGDASARRSPGGRGGGLDVKAGAGQGLVCGTDLVIGDGDDRAGGVADGSKDLVSPGGGGDRYSLGHGCLSRDAGRGRKPVVEGRGQGVRIRPTLTTAAVVAGSVDFLCSCGLGP
jgi:hypothetical protein